MNVLARHMRRGFAITIVYLGLLAVPLALIALIVPPLITEANKFADNVPEYARDVTKYVKENERLRELNEDYDITSQLEKEAGKLPDAARRRGRHAARRRLRHRQLALRPDHDPGPDGLPARQRPQLGRRGDPLATTRAARAAATLARPHGRRPWPATWPAR